MRQEQTEKQIIEQLQRISIPVPDPEYEHALRTKFIQQASRKQRSNRLMRRLSWVGSFAIVGILGFMLINGNLLPQHSETVQEYHANDSNIEQQGIMSLPTAEELKEETQR